MFELKKYSDVIFHDTRSDAKFEEKLPCGLVNGRWGIWNFSPEHFASLETGTFMGTFMIQLVWLCKMANSNKPDVQIFVWYNFWKIR